MYQTLLISGLIHQRFNLDTNIHLKPLLVSIIAYSVCNYLHSKRFLLFWNDQKLEPYLSLLTGRFINSLLPGHLGEAVRTWHFHKKNKKPIISVVSSLMLEKFLDAVFAIPVLTLFLFVHPDFPFTISKYIYLTIILTMSITALFALFIINKKLVKIFFSLFPKFLLKGQHLFKLFISAKHQMLGLFTTNGIMKYFSFSCLLIFLNGVQFFSILYALEIAPLTHIFSISWMCCFMLMIISIIPSAPSGIGVMHYGLYISVIAYLEYMCIHIDDSIKERIALFTFIFHLGQFIPDILAGFFASICDRKYLFTFITRNNGV